MRQPPPFSERIERIVLVIIGLDLLVQGAETVPALADALSFFYWAGACTWLLFTIEWCIRIHRAENWRKWFFPCSGG